MTGVQSAIEDFVRALDLDAYLVGGAVRDELLGRESKDADFLVPGLDQDELLRRLAPHGKVEPLVVADRVVGVRLYPRDKRIRALAPAGIEFAPPRIERSTGPGRHDFEIVADPSLSVEDDMRRRDFTINAIGRRLATHELVDPLGGERDLRAGILRTVSPRSFEEDPLRLVRGLRFVSQLDLDPDEQTLQQMQENAARVAIVSGERVGGGLSADGMGELSKLLLGAHPRKALRLMRDTGVLTELIPEFGPAIGFEQQSARQHLSLDEHVFAVVQASADYGDPLAVRLAALLHDLGKPHDSDARGHAREGARIAREVLNRLRYPTRLVRRVVAIVREHPFAADDLPADAASARRFLRDHGDGLGFDLAAHRRADLLGKRRDDDAVAAVERFRALLAQERSSPHRLGDLAVDGSDLIGLGFRPGPQLGAALRELLDAVVEDPSLNGRDELLERARAILSARA
jgi:putative nucleotidyltransferase with HDIG domain